MVCFEFRVPVDPKEPQELIDAKLRDSRVVEASRSFARYFGYERREDVLGQHLLDLFSSGIPDWFIHYGQEVEDREFENLERIIEVPVGDSLRLMRIYMQNIFEGDLLVSQWITIRDISVEEENRRAIEENEHLRQLAFETVGLSTFSISLSQAEENLISSISLGSGVREDWWDLIHVDDKPTVERAFRRLFDDETDRLHILFRTVTEHSREVWLEAWAVVSTRDEDAKPTDFVGVVMDRTQSKALEASLIASQRLESLGVMAGGVAHDFNNLLMSVTGPLDVLMNRYPDLADELSVVDSAANQASLLCDQLLTYAGRGTAELVPVDFSEALERSQDLLTITAGNSAKLSFDIEKDCWVNGDLSQLNQVVMNLIKNASDALDDADGHISVRMHRADYSDSWSEEYNLGSELQPGRFVSLEVEDDGKGMSETELEHLFDPFFTTKFAGRGLGMAVVMGVVRGHGGAIKVRSTPKKGSRVQVVLPLLDSASHESRGEDVASSPSFAGRVLVVDDENRVREVACKLLEVLGIEVALADGGVQALQLIEEASEEFDAMLIDVTMPGMDGVETATRILERNPEAKIILCSGYSKVVMPTELEKVVGFLRKPYRLEQLKEKLASILVAR